MEIVDTLKNGYKIVQNSDMFKFGIDAILLSHFAFNQIRNNEKIIDLGTGNGIIPFMLAKSRASSITGLEIQKENVELANKSLLLNNLENRINFIHGDIKSVNKTFAKHSFQVVITNPPYMIIQHGKQNSSDKKLIARHEVLCNLEDIISAANFLLRPNGKFFMIHKAFRLPEIFNSMINHKIEPKRMQMILPFVDKEANLVLIEGRKNGKPRLQIEKNIIIYEKAGKYTKMIEDIYRGFENL